MVPTTSRNIAMKWLRDIPAAVARSSLFHLENGEFKLVQESLVERDRLLRNAPHYIAPLPTTVPIFDIFPASATVSSASWVSAIGRAAAALSPSKPGSASMIS
ncbi:hypothetical protein ACVJBD_001493 [Rhizobium mongolense]